MNGSYISSPLKSHKKRLLEQPWYDSNSDRVQCLECDKWFKSISVPHLKMHGMIHKEYKKKYGLLPTTPLANFAILEKTSENLFKMREQGIMIRGKKGEYPIALKNSRGTNLLMKSEAMKRAEYQHIRNRKEYKERHQQAVKNYRLRTHPGCIQINGYVKKSLKCVICQKTFYKSPSKTNQEYGVQRCCSLKCSSIWFHINPRRREGNKTSIYRGVHLQHVTKKEKHKWWAASIDAFGGKYYLGVYLEESRAAIAYNIAAQYFFGVFASLNIVPVISLIEYTQLKKKVIKKIKGEEINEQHRRKNAN